MIPLFFKIQPHVNHPQGHNVNAVNAAAGALGHRIHTGLCIPKST